MKIGKYIRRCLLMVVLLFQSAVCNGQGAIGKSTMVFSKDVHDFGTIREQDGSVKHLFEFKNVGSKPFVIENVAVSCGCTTPSFSKAPIMAGESGKIEVTFDPMGRPGEFSKQITVTSNNRENRNVLIVKGTVIPRPRSIEDDYPRAFADGVRFSTLNLNYRYVAKGLSSSKVFGVANTSDKGVDLGFVVEPESPYIKVSQVDKLCAGCKAEVTVTYEFNSSARYGTVANSIYPVINGVRAKIPISTTAIFVDDFSKLTQQQMEDAPKAKLSSMYYNLGDVKHGSKPVQEFTITNSGNLPLIIRAADPGQGLSVSLKAGESIASGKSVKIKVTFDTTLTGKGRMTRSVVLITNDPGRPMREMRVAANVL